jgi:hypothetical protein
VSANYAAGLVLAGSSLLLNGDLRVVALSLAAMVAVAVFTRTKYLSLGIHGTFYLLAAGVPCGLFGYAGGCARGDRAGVAQVEPLGGGACGRGGEYGGSPRGGGYCGASRRGVERIEIVDGAA